MRFSGTAPGLRAVQPLMLFAVPIKPSALCRVLHKCDILGFRLSLGRVANIVRSAVSPAQASNKGQDLSAIDIGAHDEIFQGEAPVLVGVCARSTYCYLLAQEEQRDAETWG